MEILKKPYEISLWDDRLWYVSVQLTPIELTEDSYEPGKYYSQNLKNVQGTIPFTLDVNPFNDGQRYFTLTNTLKQGETLKDIEGWTTAQGEYRVTNISRFTEGVAYYTFSNASKGWVSVDTTKGFDPSKIYFWLPDSPLVAHVNFQYYKEFKLCTIGTDTMDTPIRATKPKFASKINGENSLEFTIYSRYWDETTQQLEVNPFTQYLTNERKVKLKYNNEWYDFVIKNISEDSSSKAFTYSCKDLFVNELSKTGFELEFDNELGNNMGNLPYLANKILEGSDWSLNEEETEIVLQYQENALYEMTLAQDIGAIAAHNGEGYDKNVRIESGTKIYVFYDSINFEAEETLSESTDMQFLYDPNGNYVPDDKNVIINYSEQNPSGALNCTISSIQWKRVEENNNIYFVPYLNSTQLSSGYPDFVPTIRGERIVKSQQTWFDPILKRTVKLYNNGTVCEFEETDYVSPLTVQSYVANPSDFISTTGWYQGKGSSTQTFPKLELEVYPELTNENFNEYDGHSYLKFIPTGTGQVLMNSGIQNNRLTIGEFVEGEKYVLNLEAYTNLTNKTKWSPTVRICEYEFADGKYTYKAGSDLFVRDSANNIFVCQYSLTEEQFKNTKIGIFITGGVSGTTYYIKSLEFYPYKTTESGDQIKPGDLVDAKIETIKHFYAKQEPPTYTGIEDLQKLPSDDEYEPYYGNSTKGEAYEKIRSITAKESNRFNLLQNLCELFQHWVRFTIEHDYDGSVALDENYRQKKYVSYKKYVGQDNHIGFRYGLNLKSIKRTLDSNGAISKIIVKDNANEFGEGGFCSITRALENPSGENTLYNFDYYIGQGLISNAALNLDLYGQPGTAQGYLGFYRRLKQQNDRSRKLIEELSGKKNDLSRCDSQYQVYKLSVEAAQQDRAEKEIEFRDLTGTEFSVALGKSEDDFAWWKNKEAQKIRDAIARDLVVIKDHGAIRDAQLNQKRAVELRIDEINEQLSGIREAKLGINKEFYKKYSRFIQEGSWIKEDYYDDNLYYMDALSTLYTSSRPQVKYTIDVVELSSLPGYEDIKFVLGDKTYVEDKEFFGLAYDGSRPYREEVIVSEIVMELDSPESNKITVQNYKTQFEDLFQRVVATTQQVQFSTGEYQRSAAIVEPGGTINITTLQNSFLNNALTIQNARDQSVIIGDDGITTTNLSRPSEMLRIVSGGLFISNDGGINWTTGISAGGINASCITTGQLNVSEVNLTMGQNTAFRWDSLGISAYKRDDTGISPGTFTRFDQFGLYGINSNNAFDALQGENGSINDHTEAMAKIKENASFGLTWDGFWLRSSGTDGYVSISSDNDFEVVKNDIPIIKIGRLVENNSHYYGIRINDLTGNAMLETNQNGELWLRSKLSVQTTGDNTVSIGKLVKDSNYDEALKVIDANNKFKVFENGHIEGTDAHFSGGSTFNGTITATGGSIGGLTIEEWKEIGYSLKIESTKGWVLKDDEETELTATLYRGTERQTDQNTIKWIEPDGTEKIYDISYQWYENGVEMTNRTGRTIEVSLNESNTSATYGCTANLTLSQQGG